MRGTFIRTLVELAKEDHRILFLTGDLGYTVVEPFSDQFPERFFNVGVAEQNMIGLATGLAEAGGIGEGTEGLLQQGCVGIRRRMRFFEQPVYLLRRVEAACQGEGLGQRPLGKQQAVELVGSYGRRSRAYQPAQPAADCAGDQLPGKAKFLL